MIPINDPAQLLGGLGPLVLGLAILAALRILSERQGPTVRDTTQDLLHTVGCALVAVGILGTVTLTLGLIVTVLSTIVLAMAVFRRRRAQQYALLSLLAATAERLMPLVPAVDAFSLECRGSIGMKTQRLSQLLRAGQPLIASLDECRGLVPPEAMPVLRAGSESGALAAALRQAVDAHRSRETMANEVLSRVTYLIAVTGFLLSCVIFTMLKIAPSMEKIFRDFGAQLPEITQLFINAAYQLTPIGVLLLLPTALLLAYTVLRYVGVISWRLPGTNRILRALDRAAILEALSIVVDRGRPIADALRTLAASYPSSRVRAKLWRTVADVNAGVSWSQSLHRRGLLGEADLAVIDAATRVGNLPWAMRELADGNRRRWIWRARLWMQVFFPVVVLAIGLVVALYAVAYFLPLVRLIERLV